MEFLKLDFSKHRHAQDMVALLEKETGEQAANAIKAAINSKIAQSILWEGWAGIALDLWGHAEPNKKWKKLKTPIFEIEISAEQRELIEAVEVSQKVDTETAVTYFLMFTLGELGYHL